MKLDARGSGIEPTRDFPTAGRRLWALLRVQLGIALGAYLFAVVGFVQLLRTQEPTYARLAFREHLSAVVWANLKMIPAYFLMVFLYTALTYPLLRARCALRDAANRSGSWRWTRLTAIVLGGNFVVYLLLLGPFLLYNVGFCGVFSRFVARIVPGVDLRSLYGWHVPEIATIGLAILSLYATYSYARAALVRLRGWRVPPWAWVAFLVPCLALLTWFIAPRSSALAAASGPLNVLVIASDSLRYDHLGVHGYPRSDISPNIDAFAREATDFQQLHVATASTLESWTSILSGQFPQTHGLRYMFIRPEEATRVARNPDLLPRSLARQGYTTIVVSDWAGSMFQLVDMGFTRNRASQVQTFDTFLVEAAVWTHFPFNVGAFSAFGEHIISEVKSISSHVRPGALVDQMLGEIDRATTEQQPFFGVLFFSTTHIPYAASYPFNLRYVDPQYHGPHRYQIDVDVHELITTGFRRDLPLEVQDHIRNLYDGTVTEFDHHVGLVLQGLKDRGLYDRTIIIVTTDHGEDLYDRGSTLGHGTNFFGGDQSTRIPFLIRVPGLKTDGVKIDAMTRNVDIAPTLLELLGRSIPASTEGTSLVPLLTRARCDLDLPVFSETCYLFFPKSQALVDLTEDERRRLLQVVGTHEALIVDRKFNNNLVLRSDLHQAVIDTKDRMVRTRRWKLVHIPASGQPIYRLYDMLNDPTQARDLSKEELPVMKRLRQLLDRYWSEGGHGLKWTLEEEEPNR